MEVGRTRWNNEWIYDTEDEEDELFIVIPLEISIYYFRSEEFVDIEGESDGSLMITSKSMMKKLMKYTNI